MAKAIFTANHETGELTVVKTIQAPIEKVWDAYTKPELFSQWWGPNGWQTTVKEFELKPGGTLLYGMKCVDETQGEWFGKVSWGKMEFTLLQPPTQLKYVDYFCDENGAIDESMPATSTNLVLSEEDGATTITSTSVYESGEALQKVLDMGMEQGFSETIDRLEALLT